MSALNAYQTQLKQLLVKSTITTGSYSPSAFVKTCKHMAVLVDGKPVYLAGEADCEVSTREAKMLAASEIFKLGLSSIGLTGELSHGPVSGSDINWKSSHNAIVRSETGVFEDGQSLGELIGINLTESEPLGVLMCVNNSLAKILDPECPELDNGCDLSLLASIH
ncbi:hypothetical protein J4N45_11100 [Vibrio sp. SCSIO 43140]|uniref:hypothetical protein n=1 Tax=Vibrio sp. SCSIO 43140 TaxID=2819100 RepID=UPI0020750C81|nr:hypothetical protein [Vibrio sp. SCSIO 43140]USD59078.1 hypothetical protein J4N45_11100 [Vibrio sp. SCSIO 43140]